MPESSMSAVSAGFNSPSGMRGGFVDQGSLPIQASIGSPNIGGRQTYIGTSQNTPPGPPVWTWNLFDFMENAYFGSGGFFDGTALVKSIVESDDQYFERRRVSYYENYIRPIIDATYLPVYSSPIKRETKQDGTIDKDGELYPLWFEFQKDCDRKKTSFSNFTKKSVRYARILGSSFIIMDNFPVIPATVKEAKEKRAFPFLSLRLPQEVQNELTILDEAGNIVEIAFIEKPLIDNAGNQIKQWKKWTPDYCVYLQKDKDGNFFELQNTRHEYNLGKTPVKVLLSSESEEGTITPMPPYYSIARCNWALYNMSSSQMRLLRSQMFAMLCAPKVEGGFAASANKGFELPADNTQTGEHYPAPFYLAPPVGPYDSITETKKHLIEELYRLAGQEGITGVRESRSGISKAFDFAAEEWVLKETAKMGEDAENGVAEFWKLFTEDDFDYCPTYTSDYKPSYEDDRVTRDGTILDKISTLSTPYNPIIAAIIKDMLEIFYEGNDEDKKEIIEWIEQNTDKAQQGSAGIPPTPDELSSGGIKDLLSSIMGKFNGKKKDGESPNENDNKNTKVDNKNVSSEKKDKKETVTK
jgi:hypothetical protein